MASAPSTGPRSGANGKPTVGDGAKASIVATTKRSDGAPQVTYNGHPLYLYEGDQKPGDTNGQGLTAFGARWYALTPAGNQVSGGTSTSGAAAVDIDPDARIELHIRLKELLAERLLASSDAVAADTAYMADLEDEIAEVSDAYVGAAVTEIAVLRGELFGPQVG